MIALEVVFWLLILLLSSIYICYPVLCLVYAKIKEKPVTKGDNFYPFVTLIISAYNEGKHIENKLKNTLNLNYPQKKLEVIVASDGSTDKTNDIAKRFESDKVILLDFKNNRGKTACQNDAVKHAKGDILVFSDANAMYNENAIIKLVGNFNDPFVGCVCGELRYIEESGSTHGEGLYWRYEQFLKKMESKIGSVLGANGSIYAVKKDLYIPLSPEIISDFVEPLKIAEKGFRVVYEPEAVSYELLSNSIQDEFGRKVRIINRSYQGLLSVKYLLNPFRYGLLSIMLLSHKLLRWYAWAFLLLILGLNIVLVKESTIYVILLLMQVVFYLLALLGFSFKKLWKPLRLPAYFCMVNYASFKGILMYYMGSRFVSWQPNRG